MTNEGKLDLCHAKSTVTNLERTRISDDVGTKRNTEVLYAGSQKYIHVESVRNGTKLPREDISSRAPAVC